ncbi:MAG TPA: metalloregulator ArsR/SmtB family transcription factor [Actinophytocola sp.]|uniref:ArsR/SmtB family transcription factor n=1 Tax=Actinophytocola sp. TaxID=1872138 RepID=UPI002DDD6EF9|nr:metalloregulator ArsR/SmtB family transcription factor [Actinophytocola sp.]HEV2778727.1 metalloregulator ArsR/SmtB family transcription factor [Actinophytocola sp.]
MVSDLDGVIGALGDPVRRRVVELLGQGPRRAGELAAAVGMSGPAMSRHLRVLRATGMVGVELVEGDARVRLYRLNAEPFVALRAWLDQVEAFWTEQLGAFKRHAESKGEAR